MQRMKVSPHRYSKIKSNDDKMTNRSAYSVINLELLRRTVESGPLQRRSGTQMWWTAWQSNKWVLQNILRAHIALLNETSVERPRFARRIDKWIKYLIVEYFLISPTVRRCKRSRSSRVFHCYTSRRTREGKMSDSWSIIVLISSFIRRQCDIRSLLASHLIHYQR